LELLGLDTMWLVTTTCSSKKKQKYGSEQVVKSYCMNFMIHVENAVCSLKMTGSQLFAWKV